MTMPARSSLAQACAGAVGSSPTDDSAAVQRRDRQQVEQPQHQVHQDEVEQELSSPSRSRRPAGSRAEMQATAASQAKKKFIAGPAAATIIMPWRGWRKRQAATGTGLAQPNMKKMRRRSGTGR